ncbi:MAG: hypothetical protein AAF355_03345 [Myxococcota bacterium]
MSVSSVRAAQKRHDRNVVILSATSEDHPKKCFRSEYLSNAKPDGLFLAMSIVLGLSAPPAFMGCLVTQPLEQEKEPLCPAVLLHDRTEPSIDDLYVIDLSDKDAKGEIEFQLTIYDCNVEQDLLVRPFVDGSVFTTVLAPAPADGSLERTVSFSITVNGNLNTLGCHSIEVLISEGFSQIDLRLPIAEYDLGGGIWWVATIDENVFTIDPSTCP